MRIRLAFVVLAGAAAMPAVAQTAASVPATAQGAASEAPTRVLPWLKLEDLSATRDRPLFAPDRRPPTPPPVAASPAVAPAERQAPEPDTSLSLTGIIRQDGSTLVVLEDNATSESVLVRSGESYGRWHVSADTDHSVTLTAGDETLRLTLFASQPHEGD